MCSKKCGIEHLLNFLNQHGPCLDVRVYVCVCLQTSYIHSLHLPFTNFSTLERTIATLTATTNALHLSLRLVLFSSYNKFQYMVSLTYFFFICHRAFSLCSLHIIFCREIFLCLCYTVLIRTIYCVFFIFTQVIPYTHNIIIF